MRTCRRHFRTTHRLNGNLLLSPWDKDDAYYFLLTGQDGTYGVVGWIRGEKGKNEAFWRDPVGGRPAYFVPQAALCSPHLLMHSLPVTVDDKEITACQQSVEACAEHADAASNKLDFGGSGLKRLVRLPLLPIGGNRINSASTGE